MFGFKVILHCLTIVSSLQMAATNMFPKDHSECHKVQTMARYEGASQFGGLMVLQQSTEEDCKQLCIDSPECAAVDFHQWETSCWMHHTTDMTSHVNASCCNHYKKRDICEYPCFAVYKDAVFYWFNTTAAAWFDSTIMSCKQHCLDDDGCHGFVYLTPRQRCSLLYNDTALADELTPAINPANLSAVFHTADDYNTWIRSTCLGHKNDTVIERATTIMATTPRTIGTVEAGRTPMTVDFDGDINNLESNKDRDSLNISTPIVLLITGAVIVTTIGLVSIAVFSYQKRRQQALTNQVPNPSSPKHWIKHCSTWEPACERQNGCKCDPYRTNVYTRNKRYNDMFVNLDTFPFGYTHKTALWSTRGFPRRLSTELGNMVLPRPHLSYANPNSTCCYDKYKEGNMAYRGVSGQHMPWSPTTTDHSLSLASEKEGARSMTGSWYEKRPRKLTRYETPALYNDKLVHDSDLFNTDKYYMGD